MNLQITLDNQSNKPLHRQLYDEIRRAILAGRLISGQQIPSTRTFSKSLGISRATVTVAFEYLLSEGYLQATRGSGTYVSRQLPDELLRPSISTYKKSSQVYKKPIQKPEQKLHKKLSQYGQNLKDNPWLSYGGDEPEIQFSFGRPDLDEFPWRQWMQLNNRYIRKRKLSLLDCPSHAKGYLPLREEVSKYLARARAVNIDADQIIVVNGSQQAIDLISRILIDKKDTIAIEEPSYIGAKKVFEIMGANLIPIPVDSSGLVLEKLKATGATAPKLIYVTPSHQFPTGVVLSLPRRLELLSFAEETGTYILEDDYDSEYRYKGRPIPALAGLDKNESVIYIGTFSKVLFPALRLGYLVVPKHLVSIIEKAKWLADRHSPLLDQQVLADFIKEGYLERHVRKMRKIYEERRQCVMHALKKQFQDNVSILGDNAGINVLIRLKSKHSDTTIVEKARQQGVGIVQTKQFYLGKNPKGEFLLNYGGLKEKDIQEGIARLAKIIEN
jgi:GntR family transcriptional regulator/MocR family aminotransferase